MRRMTVVRVFVIACLMPLTLASCLPEGCGAPKVSATQAVERFLVALRDERDSDAWSEFSKGSSEKRVSLASRAELLRNPAELTTWVNENRLRPSTWSWNPERSVTVPDTATSTSSFTEVSAQITFKDGAQGTLRVTLSAYGCVDNPWHLDELTMAQN